MTLYNSLNPEFVEDMNKAYDFTYYKVFSKTDSTDVSKDNGEFTVSLGNEDSLNETLKKGKRLDTTRDFILKNQLIINTNQFELTSSNF